MEKHFEEIDRPFDNVLSAGHRDALEILRGMTALHERVALVESKQKRLAPELTKPSALRPHLN